MVNPNKQIAAFEHITFEFCECVDADTGEEIRHPKGQCVVPGMVIVKIIYTEQEASRRKEEDNEVFEAFKKTHKQASAVGIEPLTGRERAERG